MVNSADISEKISIERKTKIGKKQEIEEIEEIELELLKISQRIKRKEKEKKDFNDKPRWYSYVLALVLILLLIPLAISLIIGITQQNWIGFIICSVFFGLFLWISIFLINNTKDGKKLKKMGEEIETLKKQEKKLNSKLEYLEISKKRHV